MIQPTTYHKPIENDRRKYKDRSVAAPSIPKAGFTKTRRRLEDGGKITK